MTIRPMDRLLLASLAAALISGCGPSKGGNDNNTNHHVGFCGDGIVSLGELCDGANLNGQSCTTIGQSFTGGNLACGSSCTSWNTTGCTGGALCGNGSIDQGELCDGANLNGQSCTTIGQGFTGGTLGCSSTCASWSTTGCTGGALCGNGVIDTGELCDGANLNGQSCTTIGQGFTGGNLACGSTCASWNTSGCTGGGSWTCDPSYYGGGDGCDCGCGVVDPDCAGSSSSVCEYCNEYGSCDEEGTDCSNIDPANNALCITVQCGNGVAQGAEVCDGADYKGETCESQGFITGSLACSVTCDALVTTGCSGTPVCGNGVIEGLETCDGSSNLGGQTCTSLGYSGGTLGCGLGCSLTTFGCNGWTCDPTFYGDGYCDCGCGLVDSDCYGASSAYCEYCNNQGSCDPYGSDCSLIDSANNAVCAATSCGDGAAQGKEQCDAGDLRAATCTSLGFPAGTLGCQSSCLYDLSGCGLTTCGDGSIQGFEECEGTNLGDLAGATCADLGFGGGTITCTGCRFDFSQCTGGPAGWSCPAAYYGADDGCDCGCGIPDPDCTDMTSAACDWCSGWGSCGDPMPLSCPGTIDATNNALCQ